METCIFREIEEKEKETVYKMEFKQWKKNISLKKYIKQREESFHKDWNKKHYVYEKDGFVIGAMVTHDFQISQIKTIGISSVIISSPLRNLGYGKTMISTCLQNHPPSTVFFLYSEIGERYYEAFGFKTLPDHFQFYKDIVSMVRCHDEQFEDIIKMEPYRIPLHFT